MISRRTLLVGLGAVAVAPTQAATVTRPGTAFGTTVYISATAAHVDQANRAIDAGFQAIRAVHTAASLFDDQSEVSRLNATGQLAGASERIMDIIRVSDAIHRTTGGAFDPTVQPLWQAWSRQQVDSAALEKVLSRVGWNKLSWADDLLTLKDNAALTFNGIAQGYAADRVMQALLKHGVYAARVDTGETGLAQAANTLAIKHPRADSTLGVLSLSDGFVAVSGDYASAFSADFQHHHIFDPALGFSPRELSSVVVVAPSGAWADGLATAFMVMGISKSLSCLERVPGCHALFMDKAGATSLSKGMGVLFQKT
jgi:FAD:protein FMN transferase